MHSRCLCWRKGLVDSLLCCSGPLCWLLMCFYEKIVHFSTILKLQIVAESLPTNHYPFRSNWIIKLIHKLIDCYLFTVSCCLNILQSKDKHIGLCTCYLYISLSRQSSCDLLFAKYRNWSQYSQLHSFFLRWIIVNSFKICIWKLRRFLWSSSCLTFR